MTVFDLTRPITPTMPVYPGDPEVRFDPAGSVAESGFAVTSLSFGSHTGTHLDAPAHVRDGATGVDGLCLDGLIGEARMIDCSHRGRDAEVAADDLEGQIPENGRVLLRTDWDARFGQPEYYTRFPALAADAVEALVRARVRLVGLETPSVNPRLEREMHQRLLESGIIIVEGLVGLRRLPAEVWLVVLPLPLVGLDGSPCRAVAFPGVPETWKTANGLAG